MTENDIISGIMQAEGWPKYTNNPNDAGGPTKGGITLETLSYYRGHQVVTAEDVKNLGEDEARAIYRALYIQNPGFSSIADEALRMQVIDAGVLHGPRRAAMWLQQLLGVPQDGIFGRQSQAALRIVNPQAIGVRFAALRIRFIGTIISANYKQRQAGATRADDSSFAAGWLERATKFLDAIATGEKP
ncbi:MAG TPA: glycosyl hydrolase 108 family protein [Alphaproteobacteria bacterium]|nr:glycosyl hydrolase 108 family protein [Alphaproteobacteria bacterium]